jgi:hypothetical protein
LQGKVISSKTAQNFYLRVLVQQAEKAFLCLLFRLYSMNTVLPVGVFGRNIFFVLQKNKCCGFVAKTIAFIIKLKLPGD